MATIDYEMLKIYVVVDDYLKRHPRLAAWRRSPNATPALSDAEVITIAVAQSCLGVETLAKTYEQVRDNWGHLFPRLCTYKQFVARLNALSDIIGHLVKACCVPGALALYVLDAKPLPLCQRIRNGRVRLLRDEGAYFGISTKGWFFGFKLHAIVNVDGCILDAVLTPGNCTDKEAALWLGEAVDGGILLGDNGYLSAPLADALATQADLLLITPRWAGAHKPSISKVRQRVETVFSALWWRFIDRVHARSFRGLWTTTKLKLLHYNMVTTGLLAA